MALREVLKPDSYLTYTSWFQVGYSYDVPGVPGDVSTYSYGLFTKSYNPALEIFSFPSKTFNYNDLTLNIVYATNGLYTDDQWTIEYSIDWWDPVPTWSVILPLGIHNETTPTTVSVAIDPSTDLRYIAIRINTNRVAKNDVGEIRVYDIYSDGRYKIEGGIESSLQPISSVASSNVVYAYYSNIFNEISLLDFYAESNLIFNSYAESSLQVLSSEIEVLFQIEGRNATLDNSIEAVQSYAEATAFIPQYVGTISSNLEGISTSANAIAYAPPLYVATIDSKIGEIQTLVELSFISPYFIADLHLELANLSTEVAVQSNIPYYTAQVDVDLLEINAELIGTHSVPLYVGGLVNPLPALQSTLEGISSPPQNAIIIANQLGELTSSITGQFTPLQAIANIESSLQPISSNIAAFGEQVSGSIENSLTPIVSFITVHAEAPVYVGALENSIPLLQTDQTSWTYVPPPAIYGTIDSEIQALQSNLRLFIEAYYDRYKVTWNSYGTNVNVTSVDKVQYTKSVGTSYKSRTAKITWRANKSWQKST